MTTMSDPKPAAPPPEVLAKQLKESLARRRWQPWKLVLATMAGGIVLMALLAWWLYPRPRSAPLQIIALDVVCTADETPNVRAQLLLPPEDKEPRGLSGHTIVFHEQRLIPKPNEKPREKVVKSDANGQAAVEWPVENAGLAEFFVRYIDPAEGPGSPNELGQIFVWGKNDPLLIVDADETLMANEVDEKASETLTEAEKEGWRIVYLSLASKQPHDFRTARGWLSKQQPRLPAGPVLSRPQFTQEMTTAKARREVLQSLHSRFKGKMLAIVKNTEAAQISKDIGLQTILIGKERPPAEVVQAATWADVVGRLE
jgi:hypothetical protein